LLESDIFIFTSRKEKNKAITEEDDGRKMGTASNSLDTLLP